jgi:hypothetical protein
MILLVINQLNMISMNQMKSLSKFEIETKLNLINSFEKCIQEIKKLAPEFGLSKKEAQTMLSYVHKRILSICKNRDVLSKYMVVYLTNFLTDTLNWRQDYIKKHGRIHSRIWYLKIG